ncbi:MAG: flagellar protein [Oscillospiraceae bacterium]|jgi:flagellar operon protein|nr:flagellar protein [Oscillospiraceae bacterium]
MEDLRLKFYSPVVTGAPVTSTPRIDHAPASAPSSKESRLAFQDVLREQIEKAGGVTFSRHAVKRAAENGINLSDESLRRLNAGVQLAGEKNLEAPLILVGSTAFLVSVKNNTVITAVDSASAGGNVFTNIDGTVIV